MLMCILGCELLSHQLLTHVLQGKRGIEKQPFQLPDFIAATGIEKIRQVTLGTSLYTRAMPRVLIIFIINNLL